jgi:transcriptional regulator with XRE-family HTH domain
MVRLRVKEVAEAQGYNMSSLSRASDVSFTTIKRLWRRPYGGANVETLDKIAGVLGVSVADLIEHVPDHGADK